MESVFITGANRGLGKGFVDFFVKNGYHVFAGMRNTTGFVAQHNVTPVSLDVSNDTSIITAAELLRKERVSLRFLINNAGLNKDSATNNHKELVCSLKELDRESLLNMFNVNSISPLMVTKHFLDLLTEDPSYVINISSCRASYHDEFANSNANYGYRASKAALNMMTVASIFDLPNNIRTFAVHPGSVRTDMNSTGTDIPEAQAEKIVDITKNWGDDFQGKFLRYDGKLYPL